MYLRWTHDPDDGRLAVLFEALELQGVTLTASCIVDNQPGLPAVSLPSHVVSTVVGDNSSREFSGYEAGMQHLRASGLKPDLWLLVNDRFEADRLRFLCSELLTTAYEASAVVGQVDRWPIPTRVMGRDVTTWVRSNLFIIPGVLLQPGVSVVTIGIPEFEQLAPPPMLATNPGSDLSGLDRLGASTWVELVLEWLTGSGEFGLRAHWYLAGPIHDGNRQRVLGKIHSILNEQLLSADLRARGAALLPFELASAIGALPGRTVRRAVVASIRRWPVRTVALGSRRGVMAALRVVAEVESKFRTWSR